MFLAALVALATSPGLAQQGPTNHPPPSPVPAKRVIYDVRYAAAADLATALGQHYPAETGVRVVPVPTSNTVLLSGPPDLVAEAEQTLAHLDRRPRSVVVEVYFAEAAPAGEARPGETQPALDLAGPADDVAARLGALREQGRLAGLRRIRVTATEGQRASAKAGEDRPVVTTSGMGPRGG
jgi:hypothetical protein